MELYGAGTVLVCPKCGWAYTCPIPTTKVTCSGHHDKFDREHTAVECKPKK